jgi:hypothetical protein
MTKFIPWRRAIHRRIGISKTVRSIEIVRGSVASALTTRVIDACLSVTLISGIRFRRGGAIVLLIEIVLS